MSVAGSMVLIISLGRGEKSATALQEIQKILYGCAFAKDEALLTSMSETKIMAIVGSLRTGSVNAAVARAAIASAPAGVSIEPFDLANIPLYNGDIEEAGIPASVQALHDAVGAADGLLIFSPEYNGSFPAVTKNAIDWMTRPPKSWEGTAVSMIVMTPGPRAGLSIREHFEAIMAHQPIRLHPTLGIGAYPEKMGDDGEVADQGALDEIAAHVAAFAAFATATD